MFKVISAEFKKIFAKPGIYVLAILLAAVLVLGIFVYNPEVYETKPAKFQATDYVGKYTEFLGGENYGLKTQADTNIQESINLITNYKVDGKTYKEHIDELYKSVDETYNAYVDCSWYKDDILIPKQRSYLISALESLNSGIVKAVTNSSKGSYALLVSEKTYENYSTLYKEIIDWANIEVKQEQLADHCDKYKKNFQPKLVKILNEFKYPTLSDKFIETYTTYGENTKLTTLNTRLNEIMLTITEYYEQASADPAGVNLTLSNKMDELANKYLNTADTFVKLVKYELTSHAFNKLSTSEKMDVMYLSKESDYNTNTLKIRYNYLFENNANEVDYAHPLTIGITSNNDINAYDYAYFVLKLFSFVIIAYAVMAACHTIAGEIKEGSMRYLAIRPVSRTKLLFGKLFSILIVSTVLAIFSAVLAICVGGAVYGFETLNILTIFNGNVAIILHPIAMIGIYLISMLLELAVYTSLALMLSTLLKSDLLSVTLILALYLINTLLPVFINGFNTWLSFYPFSNINIYALFGSSIYATTNNFFSVLLGAKVYASTNIILTSVMIIILIAVPCIIASKLFKNKEL